MMEFYSQWGEDKALLPLFDRDYKGYFVEVGALDGVRASNTYLFELLGWIGICIEPHTGYFPLLKKNRPRSICLDVAVWDENAETSDFHATKLGTWSRVGDPPSNEILEILRHKRIPVFEVQHPKLRTLDYILGKHDAPTRFDILSIDVEDSEWHVLNGFSLEHYLPRVVIIEDLIKEGFDSYFDKCSYTRVRETRNVKLGRNTMYLRDINDAEKIKESW